MFLYGEEKETERGRGEGREKRGERGERERERLKELESKGNKVGSFSIHTCNCCNTHSRCVWHL